MNQQEALRRLEALEARARVVEFEQAFKSPEMPTGRRGPRHSAHEPARGPSPPGAIGGHGEDAGSRCDLVSGPGSCGAYRVERRSLIADVRGSLRIGPVAAEAALAQEFAEMTDRCGVTVEQLQRDISAFMAVHEGIGHP